ncbi:hypothetical protein ONS95_007945 [Cadophora gregata]|uniref:uncharacterized protein n=1 Tax=Cadophora gregata TaxID=51156 RepID=UPI0026DBB15C|nr:uncharacterized protein ONS95_007945 [Cadophora gregata]KAK0119082.1 hypothetical protein ONS96_014976 [Cadophora gregata f. sp. sojae]KAK0126336.1 hypothetical protein ONS95_007945 [Cadophora gregata]
MSSGSETSSTGLPKELTESSIRSVSREKKYQLTNILLPQYDRAVPNRYVTHRTLDQIGPLRNTPHTGCANDQRTFSPVWSRDLRVTPESRSFGVPTDFFDHHESDASSYRWLRGASHPHATYGTLHFNPYDVESSWALMPMLSTVVKSKLWYGHGARLPLHAAFSELPHTVEAASCGVRLAWRPKHRPIWPLFALATLLFFLSCSQKVKVMRHWYVFFLLFASDQCRVVKRSLKDM